MKLVFNETLQILRKQAAFSFAVLCTIMLIIIVEFFSRNCGDFGNRRNIKALQFAGIDCVTKLCETCL